jgi:hypothetical protein
VGGPNGEDLDLSQEAIALGETLEALTRDPIAALDLRSFAADSE